MFNQTMMNSDNLGSSLLRKRFKTTEPGYRSYLKSCSALKIGNIWWNPKFNKEIEKMRKKRGKYYDFILIIISAFILNIYFYCRVICSRWIFLSFFFLFYLFCIRRTEDKHDVHICILFFLSSSGIFLSPIDIV